MKADKKKLEIAMAKSTLTYNELYRKSGISGSCLTRLLNENEVKPCTVGKVCKALGVKIEDVIK